MSRSGLIRCALAGVVLLGGALAAVPAQAEPAGPPYSGWNHRQDARAPGADTTDSKSGASLHLYSFSGQVSIGSDPSPEGPSISALFVPPTGQTLQAGKTYPVEASRDDPTATRGRLQVNRDGMMCGRTSDEPVQYGSGYALAPPAVGWFTVSEIAYDSDGNATQFAATYEMNCQFVGGTLGFEGSVAINASQPPAPIPGAPTAPGAVSDLHVTNVGPDGGGVNATTLTWTNPAGYGDINVDMTQSSNHALLPTLIGTGISQQWRGRASRYHEEGIDFMDTRTYRVVPRGTSGRLGPASLVTVLGNRMQVTARDKIMIGQEAQFTGRLSEGWDYVDPADVMKGPGLVGQLVLLCRQSSVNYVDGECARVDSTRTTADGRFTLSATPMQNSLYNVVVPATGQMLGNSSRVVNARVAPWTDLRAAEAQRASVRTSVLRGSVIHFTTSRARRGSTGIVRLQRLDGGRWHTIVTRRLGTGTARLRIPFREYNRGVHSYRLVKLADRRHVNGCSRITRIQVG